MNEHENIQRAYKELKSIDDTRSLKKNFGTFGEYYVAIDIFNDLYKYGVAYTFMEQIAKWFEKQGFVVTDRNVNYIIEVA